MTVFDKEWKYIKPSEINVDPLYQRALDSNRVTRMAKQFNPNIINPPKVSFRDGKYWVFDGQHTIALWRQIHKGADKQIECRVFYGMTWLDESELFCLQNGIDRDPTTNDKLRAAYNAGNPDVVDMVRLSNIAGVTVDFVKSEAQCRCVATATLFKSYKALDRTAFVDMLTVIMKAWDGDPDSLSQYIISGMSKFYQTYYGRFKQDDLLTTLKKVSPSYIIREGRDLSGSAQNRYFRVVLREYNKKRTKRRLDDAVALCEGEKT